MLLLKIFHFDFCFSIKVEIEADCNWCRLRQTPNSSYLHKLPPVDRDDDATSAFSTKYQKYFWGQILLSFDNHDATSAFSTKYRKQFLGV